ncbi:uncharacterized protein LOC121103145 [Ursus maritimus]|uniref:Uncharacterized protein LOC121103145 n=1 Tax=Ursus maritimus TaxID=29073 RepID=A0A8M1FY12_URSMA|nr:uncharacterized protein LOC121103145 [Ursus maritimus]
MTVYKCLYHDLFIFKITVITVTITILIIITNEVIAPRVGEPQAEKEGSREAPPLPGRGLGLQPGLGGPWVRGAQARLGCAQRRLIFVATRARPPLLKVQLQQGPAVHGLQLLEPGPQGPGAAWLVLEATASRPPVRAGLLGALGGSGRLCGRPVATLAGKPQGLTEETAVLALQPPVFQPQPGVLFAQPRVLPVPLVPRADGLQVARSQVGEPLLQLLSGAARTASPARAASDAATPTSPARAALPAAAPTAVPTAAAPAPSGATTHAPHRSCPNRAASAVGRGAGAEARATSGPGGAAGATAEEEKRWRAAAAGLRPEGAGNLRGLRRVLSPVVELPPWACDLWPAHTQCPRGALCCSALWQREGESVYPQLGSAGRFRAGLGTAGTSRPRPAIQRNHQRLPFSLHDNLKANNSHKIVSSETDMWAS